MKPAALIAGLLLLALIWAGPLLDVYRQSFAAHMLAHMGVVAIAAPLIAVGVVGEIPLIRPSGPPSPSRGEGRTLRGDRSKRRMSMNGGEAGVVSPFSPCGRRWPSEARSDEGCWTERKGGWTIAFLSLPVLASLIELMVVWGWHAPALRALAESSTAATIAEQASFLAAGLLLWMSCLGRSGKGGVGAFGLLLTSVHMTLLGALLALSPRPLYGLGEVTCLGFTLSAGQDQELGGVLMLLIGAAVYLAGGVALLARLLAAPAPAPKSGAW